MKEMYETVLLGELAEKLGTTVEKLWGVLLKQAPISGAVDLIICISLVIGSVIVILFVKKKTIKQGECEADWDGDGAIFGFCVLTLLLVLICVIVITSSIDSIASAFLNPEYWALNKIMGYLK